MQDPQRIFANALKSLWINQSLNQQTFLIPWHVPHARINAVGETMKLAEKSLPIPPLTLKNFSLAFKKVIRFMVVSNCLQSTHSLDSHLKITVEYKGRAQKAEVIYILVTIHWKIIWGGALYFLVYNDKWNCQHRVLVMNVALLWLFLSFVALLLLLFLQTLFFTQLTHILKSKLVM